MKNPVINLANKTFSVLAVLFLTAGVLYGQNVDSESQELSAAKEEMSSHQEDFKLKAWDFFFTLGPMGMLNTNEDTAGAPSPIMFSGGIGFEFFNDKPVNFQPKISFFSCYYLWDGEKAIPAEVENRTSLVPSLLLDLDLSHTWIINKNAIQAGAGISVLGRYGLLANGVNEDDRGGTDTSTAGKDVKSINSWFYQDLNFLYPNITISWMRQLESKWHAGLEARFYIPLGSLTSGNGLNNSLAFLGIKVCSK